MGAVRDRLTFANAASSLAVFLVLTVGAAWAVEQGSVGSGHIKQGAVNVEDTRPGSFGRGIQVGAAAELEQGDSSARWFPVGYGAAPLSAGSAYVHGAPAPVPLRLHDLRVELPGEFSGGGYTFTLGDPARPGTQVTCAIVAGGNVCHDGKALEPLRRGDSVELQVVGSLVGGDPTGAAWTFRAAVP